MGRRSGANALVPRRRAIVHTHRSSGIALALLENTGIVVGGHIPPASHGVVDVVAEFLSPGTCACANAELLVGDELGPLVVLETIGEGVAKDKTTD